MNETMGSILARLRREKGWTQEQLARELGISYQAVSKWENELSSPDLSALPLLADLFGVSIDTLFGRETEAIVPAAQEQREAPPRADAAQACVELPWPDDDTLHVVLFAGHTLVGHSGGERIFSKKQVSFQYEGPALNIQSDFAVSVDGDVEGSVTAGGDVQCDAVGGDVQAHGSVTCDTVGGSVTAGGDVSCDNVYGNVSAGGDVTCDDVYGSVSAEGDVTCDDVQGSVSAEGDVSEDADEDDDLSGGKGFLFRIKL